MVRISNCLLGTLNLFSLVTSILTVLVALWMSSETSTECARYIHFPFLAVGILVLFLSVIGMVGAWCRVTCLMWLYVMMMSIVIMGVFCLTVTAFMVVREMSGVESVPGREYKEFKVVGYSEWLVHKVNNNWGSIRSCLKEAGVCHAMVANATMTAPLFYSTTLTPLESGCCKPPTSCKMDYVSPTIWSKTNETSMAKNKDCKRWSNDQMTLCFDCESCKAGTLFTINFSGMTLMGFNIITLLFLLVIYAIGCCALHNNRRDRWK